MPLRYMWRGPCPCSFGHMCGTRPLVWLLIAGWSEPSMASMPSMRIREPRIGSSRESREAPEIRTIRAIRCFRLIEIAMVVTAASVEQRRVALRVGPPGYFEQYDPL